MSCGPIRALFPSCEKSGISSPAGEAGGEQGEETEGEAGEGVPRISRHPRRPPAALLQELSGNCSRAPFLLVFNELAPSAHPFEETL